MWVEIRPEGLDLARDKDVSRLLRLVAAISPDVVLLGPLYRLAPRALNDDSDAAPIIATLNMIRTRGACVLLEAHAGHALGAGGRRDLRPRGSSAFLGWPEFGYGIRLRPIVRGGEEAAASSIWCPGVVTGTSVSGRSGLRRAARGRGRRIRRRFTEPEDAWTSPADFRGAA